MRKKIAFVLAVILLLSAMPVSGSVLADDSKYQTVRVLISIGSNSSDEVTSYSFFLDGNYSIEGNDTIRLERQLYTIKKESGSLSLYFGGTRLYRASTIKFIVHTPTKDTYNSFIWMHYYKKTEDSVVQGDARYPGDMKFSLSDGYIMAVNYVYMDDYLCGVVPNEMGDSWMPEALKSQAVAARTYAECNMSSSDPYDVVDTTGDQVYYGYNPYYKTTIDAVNSTAGQVLKYNNELVHVFFGSSNGGFTEIPQHGTNKYLDIKPYDIIQADPYDIASSISKSESLVFPKVWDAQNDVSYVDRNNKDNNNSGGSGEESANAYKYIKALVMAALQAKGYTVYNKILNVNSLVTDTYDLTKGQRHDVNDYSGTDTCPDKLIAHMNLTVSASRPGSASLEEPSAQPSEQPTETPQLTQTPQPTEAQQPTETPQLTDTPQPAETPQPEETPSDDTPQPTVTPQPTDTPLPTETPQPTEGEGGATAATVTEPVTLDISIDMTKFSDETSDYYSFDHHTKNRIYVVEEDDNNLYIYHRRFGHGVGLSQCGTEQRAKDSDPNVNTYDKILGFYFPNTTLTTQGYTKPALTAFTIPDHSNAQIDKSKLSARKTYLSVMKDDSSSSTVLGTLPSAARIHVENPSSTSGWYKIVYGEGYGYVPSSYVIVDNPLPTMDPCTVTYNSNGGGDVSSYRGVYGDCIAKAPAVSRAGYTVEGWYLEPEFSTVITFPYLVTGNVTLYAHWVPTQYSISYNLGGGGSADPPNPVSYTVESDAITLNTPTRPNHTFKGWTGTGLSGVTADVTIPGNSTGNRSYSASWTDTQPQSANITAMTSTEGNWSRGFSAGDFGTYKITLGEKTEGTTINFTRENDDASVYVNGTALSYGQSSIVLPTLKNGSSKTYTILVKFPGKTSRTYKVMVYRNKSTDNELDGISRSGGVFSPDFNPEVKTYSLRLDENASSVKITPVRSNDSASLYIDGKARSYVTYNIHPGYIGKCSIKVVPQVGPANIYTVDISSDKSTNANLKSLKTNSSSYPVSPTFNKGIPAGYTVTLPDSTSSVKIYAVPEGYGARTKITNVSTGTYSTSGSLSVSLGAGKYTDVKVNVTAQASTREAPITKEYTVRVYRHSYISSFTALPVYSSYPSLSPGGDNRLTFKWKQYGEGKATVEVYSAGKWNTVYTDAGSKASGSYGWAWDGSIDGNYLAAGKYQARVSVSYTDPDSGKVITSSYDYKYFKILAVPTVTLGVSPSAIAAVSGRAKITVKWNVITTLKVEVLTGETVVKTLYSGTSYLSPGTKTLYWNGTYTSGAAAPSGDYTVRVTAGATVRNASITVA